MKATLPAALVIMSLPHVVHAGDVPGDKTTKAVRTPAPNSSDGFSDFRGDSDWYRVPLKGGRNYAFSVSADGCTTIRLRNSAGKALRSDSACHSNRKGYDGGFEYQPAKNGTYFLELFDNGSASYPSDYKVQITADATASIKTNAFVDVDNTKVGNMNWHLDMDYYAIRLQAGHHYLLEVSGYHDQSQISLRLVNSSGNFVPGFSTTATTSYSNFLVPRTGRYYAVVTGAGNTVGGTYSLTFNSLD